MGLLEGKVALVSGIGPGMGRDISLLFAEHGADLVLGARTAANVDAVADEVEALGRKAVRLHLDCWGHSLPLPQGHETDDFIANNGVTEKDFSKIKGASRGQTVTGRWRFPAFSRALARVLLFSRPDAWAGPGSLRRLNDFREAGGLE